MIVKNSIKITIISPIYQEAKFIANFLQSIIDQDCEKENLEVLLIDGMSKDGTRDIILNYTKKYSYFHLIDNPERTVPFALNSGIRKAKGDIIIRLDAHCKYPKNYISELAKQLMTLDADNVGGLWHTIPANDSTEAISVAACSSHPFGVGGSEHKTGAHTIHKVDTVPFGCYKREVFDKIGLFDEELTRNQDDEFNGRLIKHGGSIYIIPNLIIEYTARENLKKMRKMYYQYGLFKPLVNKKLGSPATIRQFFPALFCIGIIIGAVLSPLAAWIRWAYISTLIIYVIIGTIIGIKKAFLYKRILLVAYMPYTFLNIHLSYGIGYVHGFWKVLTGKKFNVKTNR